MNFMLGPMDDSRFVACPKCGCKTALITIGGNDNEEAWISKPRHEYCPKCGKLLGSEVEEMPKFSG